MNKKAVIISFLLFTVFVPTSLAQTNTTSGSAKLQLLKERLMEKRQENVEKREAFQTELKAKKEARRLEFFAKRQEFETNLQLIKDQRKIAIAERVDLRISTINQNATNRLALAIEKLEVLLEKFSERVETAKTDGKDTTEVDNAITEAEAAIEDAKTAVADQAAKEYIADSTTETTLKNTFGQVIKSLRQDLKATHDVVKIAKQRVMDVARSLAKLNGDTLSPTESPIVTVTPGI